LAYFKKSSPLKPLCQMNQNLVGSIYERFSIKNAYFVKFHIIWPSSFRGKAVLESTNKKQELPVAAIFVNGSG
jgi:hypothetical protein